MRRLQIAAVLAAAFVCAPAFADDLLPFPPQPANVPYPTVAWPEMEASSSARRDVEAVVARAFADGRPEALAKTKAVLVVSHGLIVAERYAPGITRDPRLQSWS